MEQSRLPIAPQHLSTHRSIGAAGRGGRGDWFITTAMLALYLPSLTCVAAPSTQKGRPKTTTEVKRADASAASDTAGLAVAAYLMGGGSDLSASPGAASLISAGPPGLPPPPPPSWLRQWKVELREALQHRSVSHALGEAPFALLRLGTTMFGLRKGEPAKWQALRCKVGDPGSLKVSLRWQGDKGDVLLGVDRQCQGSTDSLRWIRLVVRCDSQGAIQRSFGLEVNLKAKHQGWPLRRAPLNKGNRTQIPLRGGGWLLQLDRGGSTSTKVNQAIRRIGSPPATTGTQPKPKARRVLLALDRGGLNATLLFDGVIRALTRERQAPWLAIERGLAKTTLLRGVALGGIWETPYRDGATLWLQSVGQPGPRDAGLALWRHDARGWTRQALPLPRTRGEGSWLCQRAGRQLRCTFQVVPVPNARGFEPRVFRATPTGWRLL